MNADVVDLGVSTVSPHRHTAYAGPRLLVMADGVQNMSSPGRPSVIAVAELRQLDVPAKNYHRFTYIVADVVAQPR